MKKNIQKITQVMIVISLLLSVIAFSGCGTPKNLEEYIESDKTATESFDKLQSAASSSGMKIEVKENTLTYTYRYTDTYEGSTLEQMKATIKDTMDNSSDIFTNIADTFEKESGIKGVTVKVIYINGDGTEICSQKY